MICWCTRREARLLCKVSFLNTPQRWKWILDADWLMFFTNWGTRAQLFLPFSNISGCNYFSRFGTFAIQKQRFPASVICCGITAVKLQTKIHILRHDLKWTVNFINIKSSSSHFHLKILPPHWSSDYLPNLLGTLERDANAESNRSGVGEVPGKKSSLFRVISVDTRLCKISIPLNLDFF